MDTDIDDIKRLDSILAKVEPAQSIDESDNFYISEDDQLSDDDIELYKHTPIVYDIGATELSSNVAQSLPKTYSNLNAIKPYLSQEEIKAILSCPNPDLQKVMILNRVKQIKLKNIRIHYSALLQRCYKAIEEEEAKEVKDSPPKMIKTLAVRLGYPYFKDQKGFKCPNNIEIIKKKSNGEISPYYLQSYSRWTLDDQCVLKSAINACYKKMRMKVLENVIFNLKEKLKKVNKTNDDVEAITKCIHAKEKELDDLSNNTKQDLPPLDVENIDWEKISEELRGRHSATACCAFWKLYLHPDLNNSPFSKEEKDRLAAIVRKHQFQDWDAISQELNTGRSAFSLCVQFYSKIYERFSSLRFSEVEDKRLRKLVNKYKVGNYIPWTKIATEFRDRKKEQLYHRYKYYLTSENTIRGSFTDAEDILLFCLSNKFGRDFNSYLPYIPHRSTTQIKYRILNYLEKNDLNLGNWTYLEDKKILEYVEECGDRNWSQLQQLLPRNRYHIRQRYQSLQRWIDKNPDKDIKDIPRRVHQSWKQKSKKGSMMKRIAMEFQDKIPTLQEIENFINNKEPFHVKIKRRDWVDCSAADNQLLDYFKTSCKMEKIYNNPIAAQRNIKNDIESIKTICKIFKVNLKIPDSEALAANSALDQVDVQVLTELKNDPNLIPVALYESGPSTSSAVTVRVESMQNTVLPPTVHTLIALRSLLIRYKIYKQNVMKGNRVNWNVETFMSQQTSNEYKLFSERMKTMFQWPCIMSLNPPSSLAKSATEASKKSASTGSSEPLGTRALKKLRLDKIQKMTEARKQKIHQQNSNSNPKYKVHTNDADTQLTIDSHSKEQDESVPESHMNLDSTSTSQNSQEVAINTSKTERKSRKRTATDTLTPRRESPRVPKRKIDQCYEYTDLTRK